MFLEKSDPLFIFGIVYGEGMCEWWTYEMGDVVWKSMNEKARAPSLYC